MRKLPYQRQVPTDELGVRALVAATAPALEQRFLGFVMDRRFQRTCGFIKDPAGARGSPS
jgi:hypothetical protein